MAINLASKYSDKVNERFSKKSVTQAVTHNEYDWSGVNTVNIYTIPTVAMGDYTRSGAARYGTASELQDVLTPFTLTRDRSFTFTIDRGNKMDSMGVREAGKALARQNDEVIVPEIDIYRLSKWQASAAANGGVSTATNITAANAYSSFLTGNAYLDNNLVPMEGRTAFVTPSMYNFLKLDPTFLKASDMGQNMLINGQVGEVDGVRIVKVPASWMPTKTPFIITHSSTMCSPMKLQDFKTHDNPPGINGWLVEGRIYYDAFVMPAKLKGTYAHLEV
jgi:hypothetical protein